MRSGISCSTLRSRQRSGMSAQILSTTRRARSRTTAVLVEAGSPVSLRARESRLACRVLRSSAACRRLMQGIQLSTSPPSHARRSAACATPSICVFGLSIGVGGGSGTFCAARDDLPAGEPSADRRFACPRRAKSRRRRLILLSPRAVQSFGAWIEGRRHPQDQRCCCDERCRDRCASLRQSATSELPPCAVPRRSALVASMIAFGTAD